SGGCRLVNFAGTTTYRSALTVGHSQRRFATSTRRDPGAKCGFGRDRAHEKAPEPAPLKLADHQRKSIKSESWRRCMVAILKRRKTKSKEWRQFIFARGNDQKLN